MDAIDIAAKYNRYEGFPYKHLGNDTVTGIDCFNLCRLVLRNECKIEIPYETKDLCTDTSTNWFMHSSEFACDRFVTKELGWEVIPLSKLKPFDMVLMSLGSSNCVNHTAIYLGQNRIIQIMFGYRSWLSAYASHYKNRTIKVGRWIGIPN